MTPCTRKLGRRQNSPIWSFLAVFMGNSTQFFWLRDDFDGSCPPVHENWDDVKTRRFGHFWLFSWAIAHSFWLQRHFQRLVTPGTPKLGCRQNTSIWSFLAVFVGYSTKFLAQGTIRTARDPQYTKIGTSSKHIDLVISGCFRGL